MSKHLNTAARHAQQYDCRKHKPLLQAMKETEMAERKLLKTSAH